MRRLSHLIRSRPQWLRVALAGLLLTFALNSIAHVTHRHDAAPSSALHSLACGYCISFGGLADAPRHGCAPPLIEHASAPVAEGFETWIVRRLTTTARPRAPPLH